MEGSFYQGSFCLVWGFLNVRAPVLRFFSEALRGLGFRVPGASGLRFRL